MNLLSDLASRIFFRKIALGCAVAGLLGMAGYFAHAPGQTRASAAPDVKDAAPPPIQRFGYLEDFLKSVLDQAVHAPVPDAIAPLVTLAENADTIAIAALEIACGEQDKRLKLAYCGADDQGRIAIERKEKAIEELKGKLAAIKARREAEEKKKEEDSWDPFHGRFSTNDALTFPGTHTFSLVLDPNDPADLPGDNPKGPIAAIVTPVFGGSNAVFVPVTSGTVTLQFDATLTPGVYDLALQDFSLTIDSFDVATSAPTGVNHGKLNPNGSPPVGQFRAGTGEFDLRFEGMYTNDFYDDTRPMLFFAESFGGLRQAAGEALVGADDPMLVPLPPPFSPTDQPDLMGAHVIVYDNATSTVRFLENTTLAPDADVAMVRNGAGAYTIDPAVDEAVGAQVIIDPMAALGSVGAGQWAFADTAFRVAKGATTLTSGTLKNILLDSNTVSFTADVELLAAAGSSQTIADLFAALGKKSMQLATGPGAVDLLAATGSFSVSARVPWPDLFHLFAGPPPGAPVLGPVTDNLDGTSRMTWTNPSETPAQFLGIAWDLYAADWVNRGYLGGPWFPFPAANSAGDLDLFQSGGYHAWISNQYGDGSWFPCANPWTGIQYSGTPHTPTGAFVEDLGSRNVRLHWAPEIYGTWHDQIIVFQGGVGFIPVSGPSGNVLWHFIDYGGAGYTPGTASFLGGTADFTLPADGDYWFYIRGVGWLPPNPASDYATAFISVAG